MKIITLEQYENTHKDFKGVYDSDHIHGTNLNGRRTILSSENGATVLLIEGESFVIKDKLTRKEITEEMTKKGLRHLSFLKSGNIKVMCPYFYRGQGGTLDSIIEKIQSVFPKAKIIDKGDHFTAFKGGAPVSQQSHIWVEFKL